MPPPSLEKRAQDIFKELKKMHPDAACELTFSAPLELAVAAILSAQCTDKRVNALTPELFKRYRSARDWAEADLETLEQDIHSTGFFRNKAKNIKALGAALENDHGGELPDDFDALCRLPGIGRKTANLLMVSAFGQPGMIVDTHAKRVSGRLGLTTHTDPDRIERDLRALLPEKRWGEWSHLLVFHGRYCCKARAPECDACRLTRLCPFFRNKGKT